MTDVDVVILDLDGGARLVACLTSIAVQSRLPARVIVFDNGSKEATATRVSSPGGLRIEHVRSEVNLGFAGGMNAALIGVRAPFVAMINNDVVLDREWLASTMAAIESDERIAAVQSVIRRDARRTVRRVARPRYRTRPADTRGSARSSGSPHRSHAVRLPKPPRR